MNSLNIFTEKVPELESLPEKPKTFWYPNAANDFRGPVFLTDIHIDSLQTNENKEFTKPDIFVFNSLDCGGGGEVQNLRKILKKNVGVVFKEIDRCEFKFLNFIELTIKENVNGGEYHNVFNSRRSGNSRTAFYFEQEITGRHSQNESYKEVQKILYFEWDSIDFFRNFILRNLFEITYLCSVNEGYGSERSIFRHIYEGGNNLHFSNQAFKPKYLFIDYHNKDDFKATTRNSEIIKTEEYYNNYINTWQGKPIPREIMKNRKTRLIEYTSPCIIFKIEYRK